MTKQCKQCEKEFEKRNTCSLKTWNEKVRFCSRECKYNSLKGIPSWSKGKKFSEKHRRNLSQAKKGCITWMKGKKHTEKAKRKIGEASKRRIPWSKGLKGLNLGNKNPFYGRTHTKEVKERLSKLFKGKRFSPNTEFKKGMSPESHPHWMGGISFAPYGVEFNE